ncbi:UDP-4-amino-4,6-dideoxy-N-acetyl-beta-L-altrosamine transaminase [Alteromonas antoniana]|uniref:UDP-4-amino-4, 6-dideoxy-N-acetyl-beta-L-altrosamine transaminase n=1 Tax=Alteromonas antoniana TaxID=2803813 RepID=UPI001C462750|nr:UDP-4-amino-4,6-dideoxy-N-acetyl-beta-L-altrosamine transaminase [Alteromonas antoniana]
MIPYGRHSINDDDVNAVVDVLKNEFLTQGSQVPLFEQNLCEYTGARYAVACNSGTSGLHMACLAAGVGIGDKVWTSPNSFVASANCARYCGAEVDFVDIDPVTRNLSLSELQQKLSQAEENGKLPKAIVVVHFAGSSCDMKAISELTSPYGITLIEDAAHGLGGKDRYGNPIGSAVYSDFVVLSFHPVKSLTTAEGGAVLTNREANANSLRRYASHGISRDNSHFPNEEKASGWYYAQHDLGFNYRLSDIHAALGNSQIKRLNEFVAARLSLARRYESALSALPLKRPQLDIHSAWHLYVIELENRDRRVVFDALRARGVGVNVHYIPIYHHPYYQALGFKRHCYPACEKYYQNAITLPLFPELSADMQDRVISTLHEVLK